MVPAYQVHESIKLKLPTDTVVEFPASNYNLSDLTINPTISPSGSMEPSMETVKESRMGALHDGRFISRSSSEAAGSEATNLSDEFTDSKDGTESLNVFKPVNPPQKPVKLARYDFLRSSQLSIRSSARPRSRPPREETYVYCCRCANGPTLLKNHPVCSECNLRHCRNCTYEKR